MLVRRLRRRDGFDRLDRLDRLGLELLHRSGRRCRRSGLGRIRGGLRVGARPFRRLLLDRSRDDGPPGLDAICPQELVLEPVLDLSQRLLQIAQRRYDILLARTAPGTKEARQTAVEERHQSESLIPGGGEPYSHPRVEAESLDAGTARPLEPIRRTRFVCRVGPV